MPEGLSPGDKVIALAEAARAAAFVTGIVTGGVSGLFTRHKLIITGIFIVGGAIIGWIVGTMVGKILFPAQTGKVMIVKAGPGAIPATIKGNVIASLVTGMIVCSLAILLLKEDIKTIALASFCISAAIGAVLALVGSLL